MSSAPEAASKRRLWAGLAYLLFFLAVVCLGFYSWQLWGTTFVAKQNHKAAVEQLTTQWQEKETEKAAPQQPYAIVRIPRFGDAYAVPLVNGTSEAQFEQGYGRFEKSAALGKKGNTALGAHRVTHGEPLRLIDNLQPEDRIFIETQDYIYEYTVVNNELRVPFQENWMVAKNPQDPFNRQLVPQKDFTLTLVTCASVFATDIRSVAFAELENVSNK